MDTDSKILTGFLAFSLSIVIGVGIGAHFDGTPLQKLQEAERAKREIERHPETASITGFTDIRNTPDGRTVEFDADFDSKGVCAGLEPKLDGICTTRLYGSAGSMLVPIRTCSHTVNVNCLRCRDANGEPLQIQDIRAIDSSGDEIDFLGHELLQAPNTWTERQTPPMRFTGVVTQLNGSGRIIQPIMKIERVP